jgi:multidrug transporter EmrE-like cation transporter
MLQSYLLILAAMATAVASQFLFKKGMVAMGVIDFSLANLWLIIKGVFRSPYILIGLIFYSLGFLLWLFVLSKLKLSIVYPFTALNIVLITLLSHFFLKESISILQVVSIVLICTGIVLLAKS